MNYRRRCTVSAGSTSDKRIMLKLDVALILQDIVRRMCVWPMYVYLRTRRDDTTVVQYVGWTERPGNNDNCPKLIPPNVSLELHLCEGTVKSFDNQSLLPDNGCFRKGGGKDTG